MANFKLLTLAALAAFFTSSASAGYANLAPPSGFSGSPGAWTYTAANASQWMSGTARANALLNSGGRLINVPAAFRFAANAGRFATGFAFSHPLILGAAALAALSVAKISWSNGKWVEIIDSGTVTNQYNTDAINSQWFDSSNAACSAIVSLYSIGNRQATFLGIESGRCHIQIKYPHQYLPGEYSYQDDYWIIYERSITSPGAREEIIDTEDKFASRAGRVLTPDNLPDFAPGQPLPVIQPIINPDDAPAPLSRPMVIPQGEPVPVPNTDPQQWRTPVVEVVPAPTTDEPWRVDVQPKDLIRNNPSPVNLPDPSDPTAQNQTEKEKTPGLCDEYPDILACQKPTLDTPAPDTIETKNAEISLSPDSGWGADGAACPAPRHLSGSNVDFDFTLICDFMTGIRPVIIAIAWMSAAMILIGFKRGE